MVLSRCTQMASCHLLFTNKFVLVPALYMQCWLHLQLRAFNIIFQRSWQVVRVLFIPASVVSLLNILLPSSFSAETGQIKRHADNVNTWQNMQQEGHNIFSSLWVCTCPFIQLSQSKHTLWLCRWTFPKSCLVGHSVANCGCSRW